MKGLGRSYLGEIENEDRYPRYPTETNAYHVPWWGGTVSQSGIDDGYWGDGILAWPFVFHRTVKFNKFAFECMSSAGTVSARFAIYNNLVGEIYPNKKIYETAETDVQTAGVKTFTGIDLKFPADVIHWGVYGKTAKTQYFRGTTIVIPSCLLGMGAIGQYFTNCIQKPLLSWPAGGLPDPFTLGGKYTSLVAPLFLFRWV